MLRLLLADEGGVERIVEPHHRGLEPGAEEGANRLQPLVHRGQLEAAKGAALRLGVDAQPGAGEEAERALAADQERGEVGPGGGALGGDEPLAPAGDGAHRQRHVFDLPVAAGQLPRAARRQPAAHGGHVDGGGEVAEGPPLRLEPPLERLAHHPRAGLDGARLGVDRCDGVEVLQVDRDAAVGRPGAAAHAAPRAVGHQRHRVRSGERDQRHQLVFALRPADEVGRVGHQAAPSPQQAERPHVARVGEPIVIDPAHPAGHQARQLGLQRGHLRGGRRRGRGGVPLERGGEAHGSRSSSLASSVSSSRMLR